MARRPPTPLTGAPGARAIAATGSRRARLVCMAARKIAYVDRRAVHPFPPAIGRVVTRGP